MKKILFVLCLGLFIGCNSNKDEKKWTVCECKEKEIKFNTKAARASILEIDERAKYQSEWASELEEFVIACEYFLHPKSGDENERISNEIMDCVD